MPILRDSASAGLMRDSIDRMFVPFVKQKPDVAKANIEKFSSLIDRYTSPEEKSVLTDLLCGKLMKRGFSIPDFMSMWRLTGNTHCDL